MPPEAAEGLEKTFKLQNLMQFRDGSPITKKWSKSRAAMVLWQGSISEKNRATDCASPMKKGDERGTTVEMAGSNRNIREVICRPDPYMQSLFCCAISPSR